MTSVPEMIRDHRRSILDRWTRRAGAAASARGLDRAEFVNILPQYLDRLGADSASRAALLDAHFATRLRQGFLLEEMAEELAILGRAIGTTWEELPETQRPDAIALERLLTDLHDDAARITEMFVAHMREDEQIDKRSMRRLEEAASGEVGNDPDAVRRVAERLVSIVVEAMNAQTATLLLYDAPTKRLASAASVGAANEVLEEYTTQLDPLSFVGTVAAREERATELTDIKASPLAVSDALRKSGIHSLLGVRLPPRHQLLGVLYVGLDETRRYTAREVRRMEMLADRVVLHLGAIELQHRLRIAIEELEAERRAREQFVSLLAHDLRGPLSAAKMGVQLLMQEPAEPEKRRALAARIDRNIDRTDRMVRDLLDANRIRAGHLLPLRLEDCDLAEVVKQVARNLEDAHHARPALVLEGSLRGVWDLGELHRALWNLATNAVKYGDASRPITIGAARSGDRVRVWVHNFGLPLSPDAIGRLFDPFAQLASARPASAELGVAKHGWGLGLTLVQGCAAAHGGTVTVASDLETGTTFSLDLPADARRKT